MLLCLISIPIALAAGETTDCNNTGSGYQRVVSIGGSITEIIYTLGCGDKVIAADISSLYPESVLQENPSVGYMRTLSAEPILSVNPDLIIADADSQPQTVFTQLQNAGVTVASIPDERSITGIYKKIRLIADTLGVSLQGEKLIRDIETSYQPVARQVESFRDSPRTIFLLTTGKGSSPIAAGRDTAADNIIRLAGGNNVFDSFSGYKPVSAESIINVHPDFIVMPERVIAELGGLEKFVNQPEIKATPAGKNKNILIVDDLSLLGFGPRTPVAISDLATKIHSKSFSQ